MDYFILAYLGLFARILGLFLLVIGVLPVMVRQFRGSDYGLIRKTLPFILASYILTVLPGIFVVACRLAGCEAYDTTTVNVSSFIGGVNVLLGALGWILIYRKG